MGDVEMGTKMNGSGSTDTDKLMLKVRMKEGSELDVVLRKNGLVNDLKQEVIKRLELVDKNVRLIFSGKLLDPPSAKLSDFKLTSGSFVHAVITNNATAQPSSEPTSDSPPARISVDLSNLRGFDVLLIPGPQRSALSIDEIAMLRLYFHNEVTEYAEENMTRQPHESQSDFLYRCETEWAASQSPRSEFRLNLYGRSLFGIQEQSPQRTTQSSHGHHDYSGEEDDTTNQEAGTNREFFYGFFMGFALGFMMIFCIWDRNVSHKQKIGILTGVLASLLLTAFQQEQGGGKNHTTGQLDQSSGSGSGSSSIGAGSGGGIGITLPSQPPVMVIDESGR